MFAATTFFRSERMFWRSSWMLASLTCSSVVFLPLAPDGAACWALSPVVATKAAVAKQCSFSSLDSRFRSMTAQVRKVTLPLLTDQNGNLHLNARAQRLNGRDV